MPEWLIGPVSKTGVPFYGTVGSNPTSSATEFGPRMEILAGSSDSPAPPGFSFLQSNPGRSMRDIRIAAAQFEHRLRAALDDVFT